MRVGELNIADYPPNWAAADTLGLTDANGRVTLFSNNVSPDMLRGLVLHEVGVHAGLEGVLGREGKANLLNQLHEQLLAGEASVVTARSRVPADTDPAHVMEETLAYLVQHAPKSTIAQRLIADVRAWLYKTFPKLQEWMTLTEADMVSLALGAVRQRVKEAGWSTPIARTKNGAVFVEPVRFAISTGPVKYARPPRDGSHSPPESRGTEVSGGAGRPGQPDVRGNAGAGKAAAGGGDAQSGSGPARAVVGQQLPEKGFVKRRWNDQVQLGPEQRAARKAQFSELVGQLEIDLEVSRGLGDFKFRNGKRTGARGAYESLLYTFRTPDDAHTSVSRALDPEETRLEVEIHQGEAVVPYSRVHDDFRSTGAGTKIYMKYIDDMLARGVVANSDVSVSDGALAMWKSLRSKGYDVIQRVPDGLLERGLDNSLSAPDGVTAIFFVARKKPPAPDLPASDRDVANSINEARELNEHLPSCLKGKK